MKSSKEGKLYRESEERSKKSDHVLIESESLFRSYLEHSLTGIYTLFENKLDYVNPAFAKIFGYRPEELIGVNPMVLIHPGDRSMVTENIQRRVNGEIESLTYEFKGLKKNGETNYILVYGGIIETGSRRLILGNIQDISERKKTEEALLQSEKQFKGIFNNLQDAFFRTDIEGRFTMVSPSAKKMFGYDPDNELIGQYASILYNDPAERAQMMDLLSDSGHIEDFTVQGKRKNGMPLWISMNVQFIRDDLGQIQGTEGIARDITERKQAEIELINAKNQAEENHKLRTALLNNMSHEIRTPMNAIMGFSDLMRDADPGKKEIYSNIINKSSIQLLTLIDDVILLSRLQSEHMTLNKSIFKPADLVREISLMFSLDSLNKGLLIRHVVQENYEEFAIIADYSKIRQVLTNLASNAVKYTLNGSIEFGFVKKNQQIEFYVKDTGIGIPEKEISKIFETFYRGEEAVLLAIRGTGLGLNIAGKLVEQMGGKLEIESEHHVGSRFFFSIPCEEYSHKKFLKRKTPASNKDLSKLHILIVDDEPFNLQFLAILLKDKIKQVDLASTGMEAVEMALKDPYHLVIMDLKMPVMDGIEAVRIIKAKYPNLPVIAQTAYALPEYKESALNAGFDDFITKPIDKETILKTINKFC